MCRINLSADSKYSECHCNILFHPCCRYVMKSPHKTGEAQPGKPCSAKSLVAIIMSISTVELFFTNGNSPWNISLSCHEQWVECTNGLPSSTIQSLLGPGIVLEKALSQQGQAESFKSHFSIAVWFCHGKSLCYNYLFKEIFKFQFNNMLRQCATRALEVY